MTARLSSLSTICGLLLPVFIIGCGSAQKKRLELREKLAASSGMYCEFISGDVHSDVDVELNMQMARRCEPTKPLSITNYKNSSENYGVIYCCSVKKEEAKKEEPKKEDSKMAPHSVAPTVPATAAKNNANELDLSDDPADLPVDKKSEKPALPPKTNPTTLNNPAAPAAKPAPAASKPAAAAAQPQSKPASSQPAKPSNPSPQQNPTPQNSTKSPSKTPDTPETDILGE